MTWMRSRHNSGSILGEVTIYSGMAVMILGFLLKVVLNNFYEADVYGQTARRCLHHAIEDNNTPDDAVGVNGYAEFARAMGSVGSQTSVDLKRFKSACFASVGTRLTLNYSVDDPECGDGQGTAKHFAYSNSDSQTGRQSDVGCLGQTFATNHYAFGTEETKGSFNISTYDSAGGTVSGSATSGVYVGYTTDHQLGGLSSGASASGGTSGSSSL